MPAPESAYRMQKAVLWEKVGDDKAGEPLVSAGVELEVRWNSIYREVHDPLGNIIALLALVVVDQPVAIDSIMWKGELVDWVDNGSQVLLQVATYKETADLKGRDVRYTLGLSRFRGTLPTISS